MGALRDFVDWYEETSDRVSDYFGEFIEAHPIWAAVVIFAIIVTFFETYERYVQRKHVRRYLTDCLKELGNQKTELRISENLPDVLKQVLVAISNCEKEEMRGYEYWTDHFQVERMNLEKIIGEIVNLAESKMKSSDGPKLNIQEMIGKSDEADERLVKRYQQVLKLYIYSHGGKDSNWIPFVLKDFLSYCRKTETVGDVALARLKEVTAKATSEENEKLAQNILDSLAYFDEETGQVLQFENFKEVTNALAVLTASKTLFKKMIDFALDIEKKEFAEEDRQLLAIRMIECFPEGIQEELIAKDNKELIDYFNKIDETFYSQLVKDHKALEEQKGGAQQTSEEEKSSGKGKKSKKNKKSKDE